MKHRMWERTLATAFVMAIVGSACTEEATAPPSGADGAVDCATVEFGCVEVGAGEPIRLGSLAAISPPDVASLGQDALNGMNLALDYLDGAFDATPGQLLGHDVDIESVSDKCSKEGGQAGATRLAADPTIVYVMGTTCSSAALGVADTILSDAGIVLISPSNTATTLTDDANHQPFYVRTAPNDAIQARVVSDFVSGELGLTKVATIHDGGPYTEGLTIAFKSFFEASGGTVTAAEAVTPGDTEFKPLLTSIAQTDPELIYFPDFNPECSLIANQATDIPQLEGVTLMGSEGCLTPDWFTLGGGDGVYISGPIPTGDASPGLAEFNAAYNEQFGEPTASYNTYAFDAFNIMTAAIEEAAIQSDDGSLTIPRQALADAVYQTEGHPGLTGTLTCIETGDCQSTVTASQMGIFQTPEIRVKGGNLNAEPLFTEEFTLEEALAALGA